MGYAAQFSTNSTDFISAAQWALKGFDNKADNEYILFEIDTKNTVLAVSSVSSRYFFKDTIGIESFEYKEVDESSLRDKEETTLRFAVDGSYLSKVSSVLSKGKTLKITERVKSGERTLSLSAPSVRFELKLLKNKRPPKSPEITVLGEIQARDLAYSMKSLVRISDPSGAAAAPQLGALAFSIEEDDNKSNLYIMATDTFALAEITSPFIVQEDKSLDEEEDNSSFLIHANDASLIAKESIDPESTVEIGYDENGKATFTFNDSRVACVSRIDEKPIDYLNFKSEREDEQSIVVNTKEFSDAVKIASTLSWDSDDIYVKISEENLTVTNKNNSSIVKVDYDKDLSGDIELEEDIIINFLAPIVQKAFHPVLTERIKLSFVDNKQFFRANPILESGNEQEGVFILFVPVIGRG